MTRIRQTFPRDQIAHLWANKSQQSARDNSGGNMFFAGRAIYSYGNHFVIAAHVTIAGDNPGETVAAVLWNDGSYSSTTSRHQWIVRRAIPRYLPQLAVPALCNNDLHGRDWLLTLSRNLIASAAKKYSAAADCVRASGKRDRYAADGASCVAVAAKLLATVAAGVGDGETATAADKRAARSLVAMLDALPFYPADTKQQRAVAAAAALALDRAGVKRTLDERAANITRTLANADYSEQCGHPGRALECFLQAQNSAQHVRSSAKQSGLRAPKLPDAKTLAANIARMRPLAADEARRDLSARARNALLYAENAYAMRNIRPGYCYAERYAEDVTECARDADGANAGDAVPAWMRERAAMIRRKVKRADELRTLADNLNCIAGTVKSGDSYAAAGHARDAVRDYSHAARRIETALQGLPVWYPAWASFPALYANASPAFPYGGRSGAEHAFYRLRDAIATHAATFAAEDAAKLAAWIAGDPRAQRPQTVAFRVARNGTDVESSQGATVSMAAARRLWALIRAVVNRGEAREWLNATGPHVGAFHVRSIAADGATVVGCHDITAHEAQRFARAMAWPPYGAETPADAVQDADALAAGMVTA